MIPLLRKELRDRRWSLLAYTGISLWLVVMYTSMFPSIQAQDQSFNELFKSLPEGYQKAFGVTQASFTHLEGFLGIELFSITIPILLMLLAISRAGNALAGEVERGTMRTLVSLPVSRTKIFVAKYLAGALSVVVLTTVLGLTMVAAAKIANLTMHTDRVITACGLATVFGLAILSVAFALSAGLNDRGKVYMVVGGFMLVQYIMHVVAGLQDKLSWLDKLSAFHYFDGTQIMSGAAAHATSWWVFGLTTIVAAGVGWVIFARRDIPAK